MVRIRVKVNVNIKIKVKVTSGSNISVSYCGERRHAHRRFGIEVSSSSSKRPAMLKTSRLAGEEAGTHNLRHATLNSCSSKDRNFTQNAKFCSTAVVSGN